MLNDSPQVPRRASRVVQLVKKRPASAGDLGLIPGLGRYSGGGNGTPVFLSGETHGQRGLEGYSPRSRKESDTIDPPHASLLPGS